MDLGFRNRVADAVHRAVCKITGSDGFGKCHLCSLAGVGLLSRLTSRYYVLQARSFLISVGSSDRWVGIDKSPSDSLVGLSDGDYHCWIATLRAGEPHKKHGEMEPVRLRFNSEAFQAATGTGGPTEQRKLNLLPHRIFRFGNLSSEGVEK